MIRRLCAQVVFQRNLLMAIMVLMLLPLCSRADCIAQQVTAEMAGSVNTTNLQLLMLEDPGRKLDVATVAGLPVDEFSLGNGTVTSSMKGGYLWLRLCLQSGAEAPDEWLLTLLPPYLNSIATYHFSDGGFTEHHQGLVLPFAWREKDYRGFTYHVDLASGEPEEFIMRIDYLRRVSADVLLLTPDKLYQLMAMEYSFFGFYFGMLILVIFINLTFWFRLKDAVYLRYALAMLGVAVFSIVTGGYASQFIAGDGGDSIFYVLMVSYCVGLALSIFFVQSAFQLKSYYPLLFLISRVVIFCFVLLAILVFVIDPYWVTIFRMLLSALTLPIVMGVCLHALIFHKALRLYAISFLPLLIIFLLTALRNTGIITVIPLWDHLPNVGALAHLVLLNITLAKRAWAKRAWQAERDKFFAREELLEKTRKTAEELEGLVVRRTYQLDQINADLQDKIGEAEIINEQLRQALLNESRALEVQRQFTAMVSHEFRTPLAIIDTAAQNLEGHFADDTADVMPRLGRIRNAVKRMLTLMDNCLTEARLASFSTVQAHLQGNDLSVFVKNYFSDKTNWHRLEIRCPDMPLMVNIDKHLMGILLNNLVSNALKYSPSEEPVILTLQRVDNMAQLDVCDRGVGVSEADREPLFEKFFRASNVQAYPGAGLGLYLCRELADRHNGQLYLLPPTAEPGSCFRLRLPLLPLDE